MAEFMIISARCCVPLLSRSMASRIARWSLPLTDSRRCDAAAESHLRESVKGDDHRAICDAIERLSHGTHHLAEMIMNSAIEKALKNKRVKEVEPDEPRDHLDKH
jgi:hypothetical protein